MGEEKSIYADLAREIAKRLGVEECAAIATIGRMRAEYALIEDIASINETNDFHNMVRVSLAMIGLACGLSQRRSVLLSLRPGLASHLAGEIAAGNFHYEVQVTHGRIQHIAKVPVWIMMEIREFNGAWQSAWRNDQYEAVA